MQNCGVIPFHGACVPIRKYPSHKIQSYDITHEENKNSAEVDITPASNLGKVSTSQLSQVLSFTQLQCEYCHSHRTVKYIEDIQVFGVNVSFISLSEVKKKLYFMSAEGTNEIYNFSLHEMK